MSDAVADELRILRKGLLDEMARSAVSEQRAENLAVTLSEFASTLRRAERKAAAVDAIVMHALDVWAPDADGKWCVVGEAPGRSEEPGSHASDKDLLVAVETWVARYGGQR
jgi:hypothetical protein